MLSSRKSTRRIVVAIATAVVFLLAAATTWAASVAYIDGNEVWVATTDGSARAKLSSGEGDWRDVAQSDQGFIVGVQLEAGKIATLSRFTVWDPTGKRIHFGPLAGNSNGSNAYPLSLDITPNGGLLVYGYSRYVYGFPVGSLTRGHYLLPTTTSSAPVPEPYTNTNIRWPTLVGERIIGTPDEVSNYVQEAGSIGGTTYVPWTNFSGAVGAILHRTDVAATGTIFASELHYDGPPEVNKIAVVPTPGLGLPPAAGDCFLDADALARQPSLSQDATLIAWQDGGGVKVGGVPNFSGAEPCVLTKPPITISPTGSFPSIGPFNVASLIATPPPGTTPGPGPGPAPAPAPDTVTKPGLSAPKTLTLAKLLKSGLVVSVTSAQGGKATVRLTVKPKSVRQKGRKAIVIASGSGVVAAGGIAKKIKLKTSRKGRSLKRRLKGKRVSLTVILGGKSATKSIKLK